MSHECDDCDDTHESTADTTAAGSDAAGASMSGTSGQYEAEVATIDDPLDRVNDGDTEAVHEAVAAFEGALASALEDSGDAYRDVFWHYYETVSDALDSAARSEGWALLAEVVNAYDPAADDSPPLATPAIVAVSRSRYVDSP